MGIGRGALFSAGFAIIVAAIWTAVSYASDWRLGFFACFVGGAAGFGMGLGNAGRGGRSAGLAAAAVALVAILASRYTALTMQVNDMMKEASTFTQDEAIEELAGHLALDSDDAITDEGEFTPEIMTQAREQWESLSPAEQQEFLAARSIDLEEDQGAFAAGFSLIALIIDFGLFGFVWLGLGVTSAWRIGSHQLTKASAAAEAEHAAPNQPAQPLAPPPAALPQQPVRQNVPTSIRVPGYTREGVIGENREAA